MESNGIGRIRTWQLMQKYGEHAGIADYKRHPHTLRHTCTTDLVEKKVPLEMLQTWLRHRDLGSTGVYLGPTQSQVNGAVLAGRAAKLPHAV